MNLLFWSMAMFGRPMDFAPLLNVQLKDDLAHLVLVENPVQHPQGDFTLAAGKAYTFEQARRR